MVKKILSVKKPSFNYNNYKQTKNERRRWAIKGVRERVEFSAVWCTHRSDQAVYTPSSTILKPSRQPNPSRYCVISLSLHLSLPLFLSPSLSPTLFFLNFINNTLCTKQLQFRPFIKSNSDEKKNKK